MAAVNRFRRETMETSEESAAQNDNNDDKTDTGANKNVWVSFDDENEVPLLQQPPPSSNDIQSSHAYINKLESKLSKMKDPANVTSKRIVSALTEAREHHMNEVLSGDHHHTINNQPLNWNEDIHKPRCCCVVFYHYLFPEPAALDSSEIDYLVQQDELALLVEQENNMET